MCENYLEIIQMMNDGATNTGIVTNNDDKN